MGEFELIDRFFGRPPKRAALGVGDDCALLDIEPGQRLAVSSDTLVEGRHFLSTVAPERLGHKALAVNLSDLAACGASPRAFTLALTLPRAVEAFLEPFARGMFALADRFGIDLVGGDTTAGPLAIGITVMGEVPPEQALLRSGARPGHDIWVSGRLGDARLALEVFRGRVTLPGSAFDEVRRAMELPEPRVALGLALRGVATAAIDLSDGLVGDLGHVMRRSGVGATIEYDRLPHGPVLELQETELQQACLLAGGDDYELLLTAPPSRRDAVAAAGAKAGCAVTRIGQIDAGDELVVVDGHGLPMPARLRGFDHFA